MKIDRQAVFNKYNGHCAYCGEPITLKTFQVDHFNSKRMSYQYPDTDVDRFDNLMPSCRKCNNHKSSMNIDLFRREIGRQVERLMKNTQFQRALRYGQVKITESPIVFYFESLTPKDNQ